MHTPTIERLHTPGTVVGVSLGETELVLTYLPSHPDETVAEISEIIAALGLADASTHHLPSALSSHPGAVTVTFSRLDPRRVVLAAQQVTGVRLPLARSSR